MRAGQWGAEPAAMTPDDCMKRWELLRGIVRYYILEDSSPALMTVAILAIARTLTPDIRRKLADHITALAADLEALCAPSSEEP